MPLVDRIPRWFPCALFALLAALYLKELGSSSLWLDEAWEANYYAGFVAAPWYNRPVLYMALVTGLVRAFSASEFVLRFAPCAAGLAAVAVTYRLARRMLPRFESLLAAGVLALSPPFLSFAHQLKNYTFDALFAALLVLLWLRYREERSTRRLATYALAAIASFGFSFSSVFVVAAIAAVEAASEGFVPRRLARFAGANSMIALLLAADFLAFHTGGAADRLLHDYFIDAYLPWRTPTRVPQWLLREGKAILVEQSGTTSAIASALVGLAGVVGGGAGRPMLAAFAGAAALNVAASALALYPFGVTRLSIYLGPFVAITLALGIHRLRPAGRVPRGYALVFAAALWLLFAPGARLGAHDLWSGWRREEIRDLVARLGREARPGDALYVNEDAIPAFSFYWRRGGRSFPPDRLVIGARLRDDPERHAGEVARLAREEHTVWTLLTHMPADEVATLLRLMESRYERGASQVIGDARLDQWARGEERFGLRAIQRP